MNEKQVKEKANELAKNLSREDLWSRYEETHFDLNDGINCSLSLEALAEALKIKDEVEAEQYYYEEKRLEVHCGLDEDEYYIS